MTTRNTYLVSLLIFALLFANLPAIAAEDYCSDPESWEEWEELIEKYPNDSDIQVLHALRIGLCLKIERGDLTVEQGTDIFEKARKAILEKKKAENKIRARVRL
ncbi:MAG: hypothetical protein JW896_10655 [Deltaproteobacteria bacterium]|nr:hypothetical protein [Deltaproteobacteria bacterium]